ncbi:hypothetical protein ACUNV4_24070 [Granulosicoccus sp. 3-233]|uniref:hypothetical protein n=1 Tax=Granulosicoccus sp. 3-233 TaxID=3417969 RepID=UPI003D3507B6
MESSTAVRYSGIPDKSPIMDALQTRSNVLQMTQQAEDAVLKPVDCGAWSHSLRAALAARIALNNALPELAEHYMALMSEDDCLAIANTDGDGSEQHLAHVVKYMDSVAVSPRDVVDADISALQQHGVSDADIVRLTELNAFMAYQVRLVAGLNLLSEMPA